MRSLLIRAVADANVLVSAIPAGRGTLAEFVDQWQSGRFRMVASEHILEEVERAWNKPYWRSRLSPDQIHRALMLLRQTAEVIPISVHVSGATAHPEDDLVMATALSGQVGYVVTGDKAFQAVGSYEDIPILAPRDFLNLLAQHGGSNEMSDD